MFGMDRQNINRYEGCKFTLKPAGCMVYVNVAMGDYDVKSLELTANGGENIAGTVTVNVDEGSATATASSVTVTPASPIDCRTSSVLIPVYCAPVTLTNGISVKITTSAGQTITSSVNDKMVLEAGGKYNTAKVAEGESTELVFCGDNHVFVINADLAKETYKEGILWSLDVKTLASGGRLQVRGQRNQASSHKFVRLVRIAGLSYRQHAVPYDPGAECSLCRVHPWRICSSGNFGRKHRFA